MDWRGLYQLGRDFWLFRAGQFLSTIGSAGSSIAVVWWVMEKTNSSIQMSIVICATTVASVLGTIFLSPLGDRYQRKKVTLVGDLLSMLFSFLLFGLLYIDYFQLPLLLLLLILIRLSAAIFSSGSQAMVTQLVPKESLQLAQRTTSSISALAKILGSILGGISVSLITPKWSILADSITFIIALIMTYAIRSDTSIKNEFEKLEIRQVNEASQPSFMIRWLQQIIDGGAIIFRIPEYRQILLLCLFINLAFSPLDIVVPLLVKNVVRFPPWYLGALEGSMSFGTILGAVLVGFFQKFISKSSLTYLSLMLFGMGIILLATNTPIIPLIGGSLFGLGSSIASILIVTPFMMTMPDNYRARIFGIMDAVVMTFKPLGVLAVGWLLIHWSTIQVLWISGLATILLTILFINKQLSTFLSLTDHEFTAFTKKYFGNNNQINEMKKTKDRTDILGDAHKVQC